MTDWILWGVALMLQNASFTWVSRARNSGSIPYHATASVFSNGIWIASMYYVVGKIQAAVSLSDRLSVIAFYTACTMAGSVFMHWFSMRYLERGKRKVGGQ